MQLVSEFDVLVIALFHPLPTKDLPGMVRQAVPVAPIRAGPNEQALLPGWSDAESWQ